MQILTAADIEFIRFSVAMTIKVLVILAEIFFVPFVLLVIYITYTLLKDVLRRNK
jgi:hypothetical protein